MSTIIIAEAGVNHNGDILKAKELVSVAKEAGADYVKFQSFNASRLVSPSAKKADYQKANMSDDQDDNQFAMLKSLELTHEDHLELMSDCNQKGIKFFSTAFDVEGLVYLDQLGLDIFKVPSGEITNYPYLKKLAELGKPVILSTGMSTMDEIGQALDLLCSGLSKKDITVLHCNTEYPTPYEDVNLKAMNAISREFGVNIGYSDHTLGTEVPIACVALGAKLIEKHFTLDRNLPGPDHKASMEPEELKQMISGIRRVEKALLGNGLKQPSASESKNKSIARKSIHLAKGMSKGTIITEEDLISLRPGDGISPMEWTNVIGKRARSDMDIHHKLRKEDFE